MRTPKDYGKEWVNFRVNNFLSKPELKQYLMKMYGMNIQKNNTANKQGKIMRNMDKQGYWRKDDWKKVMVKVDYEVDPNLQKMT